MQPVKVLPRLVGKSMCLTEEFHPSNREIVPSKVIDVTELCPKAEGQAIIKYAESTRGRVIQLTDCYPGGGDLGVTINIWLTDRGINGLAHDSFFVQFVEEHWGIKPIELSRVIFENAP